MLIKKLSKILFNSDYESDYTKWKKVSTNKINNAATQLYINNEETLQKDKKTSEII